MTTTDSNKQTVLRLWDAFRAGDTAAFDSLISEDYVQHNPNIGNGLAAVKAFFEPFGPLDIEVHRIAAEGDLVFIHSNFKTWNVAGVDIFRVGDDGKLVEHWDVQNPVPDKTVSGNDVFSRLS